MPNLYGVSNPAPNPSFQFLGSNVTCNAGVETTVISAVMAATSSGLFYPMVFFCFPISFGATPPTALTVAAKIGAGSDFQTAGFFPPLLVGNGSLNYFGLLTGPSSETPWRGAGSTINVTLLSATQFTVVNSQGAYAQFFLMRANDQ